MMTKAYLFDDQKPKTGFPVHAFRTLKDLKDFVRMQGGKETQKNWKIRDVY